MNRNNNRIVVDLGKVAYARFMWVTHSFGITHRRHERPTQPTVNGCEFETSALRYDSKMETMLDYAKRREILDTWEPELVFQLSNSHSLVYTNKKALSLWKVWLAKQFGKPK